MTQQDREILQLAQRIQVLSSEGLRAASRDEDELYFRINKIRELVNALVPRIESKVS